MTWREYQEQVAELFTKLGCLAMIEAKIKGVRASHKIDVWVEFNKLGLDHKWVIECKKWKSPVPKEKVEALIGIVSDIGADKGILVSEVGFQKGAIDAARLTNIQLITYADLKNAMMADFGALVISNLSQKITALQLRVQKFRIVQKKSNVLTHFTPRPGLDCESEIKMVGQLGIIEYGVKMVRVNHYPAPCGADDSGNVIHGKTAEEFLEIALAKVRLIEEWTTKQEQILGKYTEMVKKSKNTEEGT